MFVETNKCDELHKFSFFFFFFKAKGSCIPLCLRKLIFEAAGENKLNYVVANLFIN